MIATKVAGPGIAYLLRAGQTNLSRENVERAVEDSLRRLNTDYIDLYQIHFPDRNVPIFGGPGFDPSKERAALPIADQVATMAGLIKAGKIRYWGLSNETSWGVMTFLRTADELGAPRPLTIQNGYNLVERSFENGLSEICYREKVGLLAYSALAGGVLTGKYAAGARPPGSRFDGNRGFVDRWIKPRAVDAAEAYAAVARRHDLEPLVMALAFVRHQWFTVSAIFGATTIEMLEANLRAADVQLDDETLAEIEAIHSGNR